MRLIRLDLHSCWEVFYIDVILGEIQQTLFRISHNLLSVITCFIVSIPFSLIVDYFELEKIYIPVQYIENSLETSIVRPIVRNIVFIL